MGIFRKQGMRQRAAVLLALSFIVIFLLLWSGNPKNLYTYTTHF